MKTRLLLLFAVLSFFCMTSLQAQGNCQWDAMFKYPKAEAHFQKGKTVYVRVDPKKYRDISYIDLFVDGKFIRKETRYPYEWAKGSSGDNSLRKLSCGKHLIRAKIVDKCRGTHYKEIYIYVDCDGNTGGSNDQCIGPKQNINCPAQYDPVCGCDGKTYDNACYAQAMGVKSWTKGPCGGNTCEWDAWFKYPKAEAHFQKGKAVYVRVDPKKYQDISYVELFVDGKFIRKETNYPYEWAKGSSGDNYLRNLSCGKHHLKTKIVDKCGGTHYKEIYIYVDCDGNTGGSNDQCIGPKQNINCPAQYDPVCGCDGKTYDNACYAQAMGVKSWTKGPCGGNTCEWDAWFKYPKAEAHFQKGKAVYVRVDPKKYQDISYVELFVDGKFIRKETNYPYEWAKGSSGDNYLRNLSCGKHHLKTKIVDKCGGTHYKEIYFYVDCNGNTGGNGNCQWDAWFKYPKNNEHYRRGKAVYVRVDPKKYQDISYLELFVDGKFIRKETNYPYEWAKGSSGDNYLRNLSCGKHSIRVKIVDKCGGTHYKDCIVWVDC